MTDLDRNTRTLIVSFAIAIMTLIPLRFVEVGQIMETQAQPMVLGETEIVLPEIVEGGVLEAPYDEIDGQVFVESEDESAVLGETTVGCVSAEEADAMLGEIEKRLLNDGVRSEEMDGILWQIKQIEENKCK